MQLFVPALLFAFPFLLSADDDPLSLNYRCVDGLKTTCPARRSSSSFVCKYNSIKANAKCRLKCNSTTSAIQAALLAAKKCKKCQTKPGAIRRCNKQSCLLKASGYKCPLALQNSCQRSTAAKSMNCIAKRNESRRCASYLCEEKESARANRSATCPNAMTAFEQQCKIYNRSKCNRRRSATCCKVRKCNAIKTPTCKACETSKREACLRKNQTSTATTTVLTVSSCPCCKKRNCDTKACKANGVCETACSS